MSHRRIERDIEDELRFHMESRMADLIDRGLSTNEARRIAEEEYGDLEASRAELALIVAAIGVYGVVAFDVRQRMREMGIRIALGAYAIDVMRHVLGQGTRVVAAGVGVGVLTALAAGKLVASMLYGVTPRDPGSMVIAATVLLSVAIVSSLVPAWRAGRVDPVQVLREE